jgi:hypothetical protein
VLIYLPELYSGAAEAFSEKVRVLAKVVHEGLKRDFEVEATVFSSKLLFERSESELDELEKAKEAVLMLSARVFQVKANALDAGSPLTFKGLQRASG